MHMMMMMTTTTPTTTMMMIYFYDYTRLSYLWQLYPTHKIWSRPVPDQDITVDTVMLCLARWHHGIGSYITQSKYTRLALCKFIKPIFYWICWLLCFCEQWKGFWIATNISPLIMEQCLKIITHVWKVFVSYSMAKGLKFLLLMI